MSREWVQAAKNIVRFWIWQLVACFIGIPILVALLISLSQNPASLAGIVPLFAIAYLVLIIAYALKIANFFKCANSAGGGNSTSNKLKNDLRSMKMALGLDVLFCFFAPILIIFTRIFFWVMYRSHKK
ncbi:hypothetical protein DNK47_02950 [Mycoplasma wenyonii]|uniref:Uncharacterized protein n=1 Tax=Mycoplasma wenyonii TaxID=65123 RepID=A0A328PIC9_9MOLU|nr:hypothetical protein [Mycoplasma wenyonii]RAO94823.1 hypothetical protein DNK47_02950 [Mycoplasma wenyonii]